MGKKKKSKLYDFEFLDKDGNGYTIIKIANEEIHVRALKHTGIIEFGVAKNFDRWCNSIDFWCKWPRDYKQWQKKLESLKKNIKEKGYSKHYAREVEL